MRSIISSKFGGSLSSWKSLHSWVRTKIVQRSICAIDQLCWRTADLSGRHQQNCLASSWLYCTLLSMPGFTKNWRKLRQKFEEYRIVVEWRGKRRNWIKEIKFAEMEESNVFGRAMLAIKYFFKGVLLWLLLSVKKSKPTALYHIIIYCIILHFII